MARPKGFSKDMLLALAQGGATHREDMKRATESALATAVLQPTVKVEVPAPVVERPPHEEAPPKPQTQEALFEDEPPAERPEVLDQAMRPGLPRPRRVGLRSDPAWQQKTIYLKKATIQAGEGIAKSIGVEFSELVEWALTFQVNTETRSSELAAILAARGR